MLNYVFIFGLSGYWGGLGFIGQPIAYVTTSAFQVAVLLGYLFYTKCAAKCWVRWRVKNISKPSRLREFAQMAGCTFLGIAVDLWVATAVSFMAGTLGDVVVSAQGIVYNVWCLLWSLFYGIACSIETRVAQHLGAGNHKRAVRGACCGFLLSILTLGVVGGVYYALSEQISRIFSQDARVLDQVSHIKLYLTLSFCISAIGQDLSIVLTACAQPGKSACISVVSSLLVQLPLCYLLTFKIEHLGLPGLWIACLSGESARAVAGSLFVARVNWEDEALEAHLRQTDGTTITGASSRSPRQAPASGASSSDEDVPDVPPSSLYRRYSGMGTPPHSGMCTPVHHAHYFAFPRSRGESQLNTEGKSESEGLLRQESPREPRSSPPLRALKVGVAGTKASPPGSVHLPFSAEGTKTS